MLEKAIYENSIGQTIEFGKPPFFLNYSDLRNYRWQYESINNKVVSFKKGITEKPFPVQIAVPAGEDADEVKNRIYEVFEYDIKKNVRGKLYVGDYYIRCNIIESRKSAYLENKNMSKMDFVLVMDSETWIKENEIPFVKSELMDVVDFAVYGKTEDYISIAEDGTLGLTAQRKDDAVVSAIINTLPLCSYGDAHDVLYRQQEGTWGINKQVEVIGVDLSEAELLIDSDFTTYRIELQHAASDVYFCNVLDDHVDEISFAENIEQQEGFTIESTLTESTNVFVEMHGTSEGVQNFKLRCVPENAKNDYEYWAGFTNDELSAFTNYELQYGFNLEQQQEIKFELPDPLYEGDSIQCIEGVWQVIRSGKSSNLDAKYAEALDNLMSYAGFTAIYTVGDAPYLKASFKSKEWRNNRVSNTDILHLPLMECVNVYGDYAYIRVKSTKTGIKIHYVYEEAYFYELDSDAQAFFAELESYDDVKKIIVADPLIDNDFGSSDYPKGYNWGYYNQQIQSESIISDALISAPFKLIIYGQCHEPEIIINNHTYKILDTIERGEYVIVDSAEKTITKYCANGATENIFNKRYKEQSIFEPIAEGANEIIWNREFSFDLILMDERSEPKWT